MRNIGSTHLAVLGWQVFSIAEKAAEKLVRLTRATVQRFHHFRHAQRDVTRPRVLLWRRLLVDVDVYRFSENTESHQKYDIDAKAAQEVWKQVCNRCQPDVVEGTRFCELVANWRQIVSDSEQVDVEDATEVFRRHTQQFAVRRVVWILTSKHWFLLTQDKSQQHEWWVYLTLTESVLRGCRVLVQKHAREEAHFEFDVKQVWILFARRLRGRRLCDQDTTYKYTIIVHTMHRIDEWGRPIKATTHSVRRNDIAGVFCEEFTNLVTSHVFSPLAPDCATRCDDTHWTGWQRLSRKIIQFTC